MTRQLLDTVEKRLDPAHTAVMVIDMQNDFCAEKGYVEKVVGKDVSACRAVVPAIMDLVAAARERGMPVFWIKANYDPDRLPEGMLAKQREKSTEICCGTGSWGHDFYGVTAADGEPVIEKSCYSAFVGTEVEKQLRRARHPHPGFRRSADQCLRREQPARRGLPRLLRGARQRLRGLAHAASA